MEQPTFEGTWEEVLLHSSELVGRRVKLVVLTNQPTSTLDKVLKGRVGRVNFQPSNLSERTAETFTDSLTAKHQRSDCSQ
jgi:hypothetical protein